MFRPSFSCVYLSQVTVAAPSNCGKAVRVSDVAHAMFHEFFDLHAANPKFERTKPQPRPGRSEPVNREDEGEKSANAAGGPVCTE